ncbi:hypothetical protein CBM2589_B10039 [Cupriavidus taiwanensis]|uniref:Uncharacterized protein n=1 Tax=Cupriavidus taiwanensis TaxID=164546 RepID=A0A375B7V6_9BURK|nr:hypothetical protein CBM2589_B10039 [Cupriavidus taiwanensis]
MLHTQFSQRHDVAIDGQTGLDWARTNLIHEI